MPEVDPLLLSGTDMSHPLPPPKIGPQGDWYLMASLPYFKGYFSLFVSEKINDLFEGSFTYSSLDFFSQMRGVKPPMTLPYSVLIRIRVLGVFEHLS